MSPFRRRKDRSEQDDPDLQAAPTEAEDDSGDDPAEPEQQYRVGAPPAPRPNGPYDVSEVEDVSALLDLGALLVPAQEGMELRLELSDDGETVVGLTIVLEESAAQVQAFAAPRREGIWDEVRDEIAAGLTQQGGTADVQDGPFGRELLARVPAQDEQGRSGLQPARFVGVDGPRWFLRAVFTGAAAVEAAAAEAIEPLVRALVVVRGDEAMAPREMLPLKLPEMPDDGTSQDGEDEDGSSGPTRDDLNPFERGPEITEIR